MFAAGAADLLPPLYCDGQDLRHPLISPLFGNWNGLPPLLFHAGSTEMLLDDSVRAHDRALQAGVAAEIEVWCDLPHVFQVFAWLPEAKVAMRKIADFIVQHAQPVRNELPRIASEPSAVFMGAEAGIRQSA
jgi:acetyl esterase/lipase